MNRKAFFLQPLIGVFCIALAAQITFDLSMSSINIPITGQTLGVILVAYFSKKYYGVIAIFAYLLLGGLGLPIFAEGASGWEKFSGGTAGFLIGFLLASILIYFLKQSFGEKSIALNFSVNILGTVIILIAGIAWLAYLYGFTKALEYGFYPFWIGAIIKIAMGILIIFSYQKYKEKKALDSL